MLPSMSRRQFTSRASALLALAATGGCRGGLVEPTADAARLHSRTTGSGATPTVGFQPLGLSAGRDGFIYVSPSVSVSTPTPLMVLLHGATGSAEQWRTGGIEAMVDGLGVVVMCPSARDRTWDFWTTGWGADVQFIDAALAKTFERCRIDPTRIALGGFSDGASYGLSLGVFNGDLFSHLIGFSPGFLAAAGRNGAPKVYIQHGTADAVLPLSGARGIVDLLRTRGYDVTFTEFDGGHEVSDAQQRAAATWFVPPSPLAVR